MNETLFVPSHGGGVAFCSFSYSSNNHNDLNYKIPKKNDYCSLPIDEITSSSGNFTLASDGIIVPYDGYIMITSRVLITSVASGSASSNLNNMLGISKNDKPLIILVSPRNLPVGYFNLSWSVIVKKNDKIGVHCYDYVGNAYIWFLTGNIVYV